MPAVPICPAGALVEISTVADTWIDISDWVRRVDPGVRERTLLTFKTFGGSKSCTGTADPVEIELEALYTEADSDVYAVIRDAHYDDTPVSLRWQVNTAVGGKQWVAADCRVPTFDEPEVSADADEPLSLLATLSADSISWVTATP